MSNIGSRTSSTTAATTAPVLGYYNASNIVLEESMMQVSFGLTKLKMLNVKQGGIKYHFLSFFSMTRLGIELWSPGPLENTLLIWPMVQLNSFKEALYTINITKNVQQTEKKIIFL